MGSGAHLFFLVTMELLVPILATRAVPGTRKEESARTLWLSSETLKSEEQEAIHPTP